MCRLSILQLIDLFSWILVCSLVGIFYTTVYTARLTKPGYTKIIDTLEDFIENGKNVSSNLIW